MLPSPPHHKIILQLHVQSYPDTEGHGALQLGLTQPRSMGLVIPKAPYQKISLTLRLSRPGLHETKAERQRSGSAYSLDKVMRTSLHHRCERAKIAVLE